MRHGGTEKKFAPQAGPDRTRTEADPVDAHPAASVTVTLKETEPDGPAVKVIARVPAPDVMLPFTMDQEYTAPAPAEGIEAKFPLERGQAEGAEEIEDEGSVRTTAVVDAAGDAQPFTVTNTL